MLTPTNKCNNKNNNKNNNYNYLKSSKIISETCDCYIALYRWALNFFFFTGQN